MNPLVTLAHSEEESESTHYIICPYAGGASSAFRTWRALSLQNETVSIMVYPGRENRIDEPLLHKVSLLAQDVVQTILNNKLAIEKVTLVGHSMGTQVAHEACKMLVKLGHSPKGLVLSGCHAPHIEGRHLVGDCDDRTFVEHLIDMGGCDHSLAENPSWWPIFLPALRADFAATEDYLFTSPPSRENRLTVPTILISGDEDREAYYSEVDAWQSWCSHVVSHQVIKGDHFYATSQPERMLECMRALSKQLAH
ncbi:thioesterase domain-containing protein [Vibrio sp. Of14-4]|uniref:thioesterase II family protein n=1 Tax=Vibrio sp. Of14-4 TaxID=2724878 RepID=UPI001EF2C908|nr:alpha/beta fold hydrolase [Vibrio sp. Of14-4]MCG7488019.1 thioesterase domain-containing protein [Vibrio sp. Of14-4]